MELAMWVRDIEPWTWNWFVRHSYWMFGAGLLIGLVLGHINGFLHGRGTIYRAFRDLPESGSATFRREQ